MSSRPPTLLLAAIGNERDGYRQVRWEAGVLAWRDGAESERLVPDEQAWRLFRRAVEMNDVWEWRERYDRGGVEYGTYWVLELEVPGRKLSCTGVNDFPPGPRGSSEPTREFHRVCTALGRLAGSRPFGVP